MLTVSNHSFLVVRPLLNSRGEERSHAHAVGPDVGVVAAAVAGARATADQNRRRRCHDVVLKSDVLVELVWRYTERRLHVFRFSAEDRGDGIETEVRLTSGVRGAGAC